MRTEQRRQRRRRSAKMATMAALDDDARIAHEHARHALSAPRRRSLSELGWQGLDAQ